MSLPPPGTKLSGFEILTVSDLSEFQAKGVLARHLKTGCRVFHVANDEEDNLFAIAFKTPPRDDTGVAHILEHSVLCGSRHFPVKDPFLLLLKGSMNTYMNAYTFPDKTVYPASSQVEQDFYNLFKVYGDAVFFPLLRKEAFLQEGHRREISDDGDLSAVGIVYNEMKGNYSSHESIASEWAYRSLFTDSPYVHDSGGEPAAILDLSYENFKAFHAEFYHPSNAAVFLYGNLPTETHLKFLDENFLKHFEARRPVPDVSPAPRRKEPLLVEKAYPAGADEKIGKNSSVTLNWLLYPVTDPLKVLSFEILAEILLGHAGAPLQKALVESGLGEDLSPATGVETETLELAFSVGLRGTSPKNRKKIEELVFSVLRELRDKGIDKEHIEGALLRVEFRSREIKAGAAFGMRLMRRALRGWLHGEPPELTMEFRRYMDELKILTAADRRYFEKTIDSELLNNPHRTTLIVRPDPELGKKFDDGIREKLADEAAALSAEDRGRLVRELAAFKTFQESADPPEARATIPSLELRDIPRRMEKIPTRRLDLPGLPEIYGHDLYTNGIVYADIAFDLEEEDDAFMYLPLYSAALTGIGAGGKSYDRMALDLSLKTGGFSTQVEAGTLAGGGKKVRKFFFARLKCLEETLPEALDLVRMIFLEPDFTDAARLRDIFLEYRNDLKSAIIPGGHSFAASRAERGLSAAEALEEKWKGLSQYLFAAKLREKSAPGLLADHFDRIRKTYIVRDRMLLNITCPEASWPRVTRELGTFVSAFPGRSETGAGRPLSVPVSGSPPDTIPPLEGIAVSSAVGFVATAVPGSRYGTREHAHEAVLAHLLNTGYLWEKIRMKGGAYGAFCSALGREEIISFASYRDPNIVSTLAAFRGALEDLAAGGIDPLSCKDAVIGTAAKDMKPLSPGSKSIIGFKRVLYTLSDELRKEHQDRVLETEPRDLVRAAERILCGFDRGFSAVIAGKKAILEATDVHPELGKNIIEVSL